jgi:hypothetical protein
MRNPAMEPSQVARMCQSNARGDQVMKFRTSTIEPRTPNRLVALLPVAMMLVATAMQAHAAPPKIVKTEGPWRYTLNATHGPMGPGHFDAVPWVLPAVFWSNTFVLRTPAVGPMTVIGSEVVWHNIALHGGELVPWGPYGVIGRVRPPTAGGGWRTGVVGGGQRHVNHPTHWDWTIGSIRANYATPTAIAELAYATVGIHDPPPDCDGREGGMDGDQVVPPSGSPAFGTAAAAIFLADNTFTISITVYGTVLVDVTGAKLRAGARGQTGPVILDLGPPEQWWDLEGQGIARVVDGVFPAAYVNDLLAGRTYVELNTISYPAGMIRGQLVAPPMYTNSEDLDDPFKVTRAGGHCGVDGDATDLQTVLGLLSMGWPVSAPENYALADDFVVPSGQTWIIDGLMFYVYQVDAPGPTITSIDYAFSTTDLLGQPQPAWATAYVDSTATGVFRKRDSDSPSSGCQRRLQEVFVPLTPAHVASEGRHWLAWRATGSASYYRPSNPPVVIPGQLQKYGANGLQSLSGATFQYATDGGTGTRQDFVFSLTGTVMDQYLSDRGDLNCDGSVDILDVDPFVLALLSTPPYCEEYYAQQPGCEHTLADTNGDGNTDGSDIAAFVTLLLDG